MFDSLYRLNPSACFKYCSKFLLEGVFMEGIFTLRKPKGMTSFDVVRIVKRRFECRTGHAGTLDPAAEGLLILLTGRFTKMADMMLRMKKVYHSKIQLGAESATYDSEGEVTRTAPIDGITKEKLEGALSTFSGEIEQPVPPYSAAKHKGKPLYRYARKGVIIEKTKKVTIWSISLVDYTPPLASVVMECSSGTYVRSLAHELGKKLGCGGMLASLTRTKIGPFSIEDALDIEALDDMEAVARNMRNNIAIFQGYAP